MRNIAIEYPSQGQMHFADLGGPPDPGPTEVLIETRYSGVTNGTERHALLGEHGWNGFYPSRHGYQCVGKIRSIGESVTQFDVDDWVFYGRYVGHRGWHIQDLSSSDTKAYDAHLVIRLPDGLDRESAALLGVAGVAMRGVRRFRVGKGQRVWVAGAGPIGQFASQAARSFGANVTISEPIALRRSVAEELGAHRVLDPTDPEFGDAIAEGCPYDCIIDACGAESLLDQIRDLGLLAHRGVIGLLAVRSETKFLWSMLHGKEGSIEVSCHFGLDDLRILLDLIAKDVIKIDPMITHRESIENAPQIYQLLRDSPSMLLGIIFDWG